MIGESGKVIAIDHIKELTDLSKANIRKHHASLFDSRLEIITEDGRLGYPSLAPYNVIHVGAAAKEIPKAVSFDTNII